jgi:transcriptional regulator with XRE-family HTH domain
METSMSFGDYLFHLVRSRGMSMQEFASRCNCSPSSLSRIRTGKRMPRKMPLELWAKTLDLDNDEQHTLEDLAMLSHAPEALRRRLHEVESHIHDEHQRRQDVEMHYAEYRKTQNYYDGYWLAYNFSLFNDGRILRSMAHIKNDHVRWMNKEGGQLQYSYNGQLDLLGDKIFIRMEEDRGSAEYVQMSMHSLFDFREPAFLYGILTGISGKSIRHPLSNPAASKVLMVYIGDEERFRKDPQLLDTIEGMLGNFLPMHIAPFYPPHLGDDKYLRDCLKIKEREDLDAVIQKILINHSEQDEVLCADFS